MRIGVLVLAAGRRAGGPETYEVELLRALDRCGAGHEYIVYCTDQAAVEVIGVYSGNFKFRILRPAVRWVSLAVTLPILMRKDRIDLLHATYAPPPFHSERLVMTVHGLVNFVHPEFFSPDRLRRLNPLMRKGIKQAESLLFVSEHAMRQTQEMFHIPAERSMVVYHGVGAHFRPIPRAEARMQVRERFGVDGPYLLYCGKIQPGKNVELLVSAYNEFARRTGCTLPLLMVGRNVSGILHERTDARSDSGGTVILAGHVPSEELPAIYSAAEMLLFPSLFESFGLPVLESMACGTPVICSNAAALPEIAGGAALMVDPHSIEELVGAMIRLSQSSDLRETLIGRGQARARQFSWDQCARDTLKAYAQAAR